MVDLKAHGHSTWRWLGGGTWWRTCALQRQTAVTAYLKSKQLLLFVFALQSPVCSVVENLSPLCICPRAGSSLIPGNHPVSGYTLITLSSSITHHPDITHQSSLSDTHCGLNYTNGKYTAKYQLITNICVMYRMANKKTHSTIKMYTSLSSYGNLHGYQARKHCTVFTAMQIT